MLQIGQYGILVGANLAGRESRNFCSLGAGHVRLVHHGLPTHHLHDASLELEGEDRIGDGPLSSTKEITSGSVGGKDLLYLQSLEQCLIPRISSDGFEFYLPNLESSPDSSLGLFLVYNYNPYTFWLTWRLHCWETSQTETASEEHCEKQPQRRPVRKGPSVLFPFQEVSHSF